MDSINASYNLRTRVVGLAQLSKEHIISGPHLQEAGGKLETSPVPAVPDELSITIRPDAVRSSRGSMSNVFLPTEQTASSRILSSWHRGGVWSVLADVATETDTDVYPGWLQRLAALLYGLVRLPYSLTSGASSPPPSASKRPHLSSLVRLVAWHPHTARLALALCDDSVRVYQSSRQTVPIVKHRMQRGVADLHWKPHSSSLLAVASERCILIWTVEPSSVITRPSGNCCQILSAPNHTPVTSVQWSPMGDLLVSSSPADGCVLVWRVADDTSVPLSRVWRQGNVFCRWSPDASRILTATTGHMFRVWETHRWTDSRWRTPGPGGHVRAACWSPDGRTALFATSAEPVVYSLSFVPVLLKESAPKPVPAIDLTACRICDEHGDGVRVGGQVSTMSWDPTGRRLAICFTDSDSVAIFNTELQPHLRVTPLGLIRPQCGELPVTVAFQLNLKETANLCIAWSDGRLQHVPMLLPACTPSALTNLNASVFSTPFNNRTQTPGSYDKATPGGPLSGSLMSPPVGRGLGMGVETEPCSPVMSPGALRLFSVPTP